MDTGLPWAPAAPRDWVVAPAKFAVRSTSGSGAIKNTLHTEAGEGRYACFSASGQDVWSDGFDFELEGLVLSAVGARCGKVFKADGRWSASANTHVLVPEVGFSRDFLWYLMNDERFWERGGTAQPFVKVRETLSRKLPFPPLQEQIAIASYLDAETARIDGLIEEKERLVGALEELRSSVMGEAVQRGLNPSVELIETGVPWIGRAPSHWKVMRLKHLLDGIEQGWSPQCDGRLAEAHEWGVLKAGACNGGIFRADEHKALQAGMDGDPSIEVKAGDVLMSRASGSMDLVGSVAYVEEVRPKLMLSDKIFRLRLDQALGTSAKWLAIVFNTPFQRRQIASYVGGAEGLARNITSSAIKELWLAVPPPGEQDAIVEHASARLAQIDDLSRFVKAEVALLQELRAATITDAVLGRIDVREHMKN